MRIWAKRAGILPLWADSGLDVRLLRYGADNRFPAAEFAAQVQEELRAKKQNRVAIMVDDDEVFDALRSFDLTWLDHRDDYHWSGWKYQRHVGTRAKRVVAGRYDHWFQWYMRTQRFRAFHTVVFVNPAIAFSDVDYGGYLDGLFARLLAKARRVIVVSKPVSNAMPAADELRTKEVFRALLYGTRLSKPALFGQAHFAFFPISGDTLERAFKALGLRLRGNQTRYQLDSRDESMLQAMVPQVSLKSVEGEPSHVEPLFERERRLRAEARIPDRMLADRTLEDIARHGWVTVPSEAGELNGWLVELSKEGDPRIRAIFETVKDSSRDQWGALLNPSRIGVRRILDSLVGEGKLERRMWYREVGRPAFAFMRPGKLPFLDNRCGQCAFYVPSKRKCRLWWLVNKMNPFFQPRWKQPGSKVTEFEIHKMRYASKIGPRSSACLRFLDKKRDHLREAVPERCEICGIIVTSNQSRGVTCSTCKTSYVKWNSKVRVMTAYEHEFNRTYHEITGGEAKSDLEVWKANVKADLQDKRVMFGLEDVEEALVEETTAPEPEPPRVRQVYSQALQDRVDELARNTDISRQFSIAMAQTALNATRRIVEFGRIYRGDADPLIAQQEKYLGLLDSVPHSNLLPYEALVMKQYWLCYGLALRGVLEWIGPRKRSRFVAEYVEDSHGRARGYSPVDAAVNYLHQRRRRQAEHINQEVGFPGMCDGFLHKERYGSRKIGLLFDMIDPFKFADREELLLVLLDRGLTWKDFKIETDRRGSGFYYPRGSAVSKLDQTGAGADGLVVRYLDLEVRLREAYKLLAEGLLEKLTGHERTFKPFVLEFPVKA